MITLALLGSIVIYVLGLRLVYKKSGRFGVVDLGFLFSTFVFFYTVIPAITVNYLNLGEVPGWPWQELNKLRPSEESYSAHLWRHNLFLGMFLTSYLTIRRTASESAVEKKIKMFQPTLREFIVIFSLFVFFAVIKYSLSGSVSTYVDKYLQTNDLSPSSQVVLAIINRALVGIQYLLLIFISTLPTRKWVKVFLFASLVLYLASVSYGSRIEVLFTLLAIFAVFNIFLKKLSLALVLVVSVLMSLLFGFVEVFRYYEFDLNDSLLHIKDFGITPMGEFGSVFFSGFHLYSLFEANQMPQADIRMFFYEFVSLFQSNSNTEFNPQYWYWMNFYPNELVPPQTNGPIADSAIWGGGIYDLSIRATVIGIMFGWLANRFFLGRASLFWTITYLFYYSTCVMTIKYGVFWQLNPMIKTIVPMFIFYLFSKNIFKKTTHG